MEELFSRETPEDGNYKARYELVLDKLAEARDEIVSLNQEIYKLQQKLDDKEHSDRVVIETKKKIKSVDVYFE